MGGGVTRKTELFCFYNGLGGKSDRCWGILWTKELRMKHNWYVHTNRSFPKSWWRKNLHFQLVRIPVCECRHHLRSWCEPCTYERDCRFPLNNLNKICRWGWVTHPPRLVNLSLIRDFGHQFIRVLSWNGEVYFFYRSEQRRRSQKWEHTAWW